MFKGYDKRVGKVYGQSVWNKLSVRLKCRNLLKNLEQKYEQNFGRNFLWKIVFKIGFKSWVGYLGDRGVGEKWGCKLCEKVVYKIRLKN